MILDDQTRSLTVNGAARTKLMHDSGTKRNNKTILYNV